eukprot:TRINITY_DN22781_c0_g1_i1.p1 TRINITY_DN22781_c0_g1~~TRINITY_DN22781_c0_g1_i1.p1  ORF type:complete len:316 (-),score=75.77 TRINITY_DN22781_c0_g1_i1:126-1073(-)
MAPVGIRRPQRRRAAACVVAGCAVAAAWQLSVEAFSQPLAGRGASSGAGRSRLLRSASLEEDLGERQGRPAGAESSNEPAQKKVPGWITAMAASVLAFGIAGIISTPDANVETLGTAPAEASSMELLSATSPPAADPNSADAVESDGWGGDQFPNPFQQQSNPRVRQPLLPGPEARPPADDKAPDIPLEERHRRQSMVSEDAFNEVWYENGKRVFVAKCAGCHPGGQNSVKRSKDLTWGDMTRNGFGQPPYGNEEVRNILRYGKGKMPGFAADCPDKGDVYQCGVIVPLSEETLQDLEDFILNRANNGWKGRGGG